MLELGPVRFPVDREYFDEAWRRAVEAGAVKDRAPDQYVVRFVGRRRTQ